MENMGIQIQRNKLRGRGFNLEKVSSDIQSYLSMLNGNDFESSYLAISLIRTDGSLLNCAQAIMSPYWYTAFMYYLNSILDSNVSSGVKDIYIVRVYKLLVHINRTIENE